MLPKIKKNYFNFPQKGDGLGGYNFVTKHHSKASNFVTPQKKSLK
jgi:hypothetical protein